MAVGTNTAPSTSAIETSALPTSSIVARASRGSGPCSRPLDVSTPPPMAFIDPRVPTASHEPEQRRFLIENERRHHAKRADQRYRNGDESELIAGPKPAKNPPHGTMTDEHSESLGDRLDQLVADCAMNSVGCSRVVVETHLKTGFFLQLHHRSSEEGSSQWRAHFEPGRCVTSSSDRRFAAESCWSNTTTRKLTRRDVRGSRTVRPSAPDLTTMYLELLQNTVSAPSEGEIGMNARFGDRGSRSCPPVICRFCEAVWRPQPRRGQAKRVASGRIEPQPIEYRGAETSGLSPMP